MNWTTIVSVAIPVGIALIAYIISPWLSYKRELKRIYEAPFRRDCAFFYGEAFEFYKRYIIPLTNCQIPDISAVQKIDDFRALHESQVDIPRWLGKIKKEKEELAEKVWNFADTIDRLWHKMEDKFEILKKLSSRDDILKLDSKEREEIANFLMEQLKGKAKELNGILEEILAYLIGKLP